MSGTPNYSSPYGPHNPGPTSGSGSTRHPDPEDLTLYAMQLLAGEEAAQITQHIEHCSECRREVAQVQGDLAMVSLSVEVQNPGPQVRQRFLKQVARERKPVPVSAAPPALAAYGRGPIAEEPSRRGLGAAIFGWSGWLVAAGLSVATVTLYRDRAALRSVTLSQSSQIARLNADAAAVHQIVDAFTDPGAMRVTLTTKPAPPEPLGRATYNPDKGTLIFLASKMNPLQQYKVYELWVIPANGTAPIPAGTFRPDANGNASLLLPDLPKGVPAKAFGVTIEDEGGSQTPTLPIIMAGS